MWHFVWYDRFNVQLTAKLSCFIRLYGERSRSSRAIAACCHTIYLIVVTDTVQLAFLFRIKAANRVVFCACSAHYVRVLAVAEIWLAGVVLLLVGCGCMAARLVCTHCSITRTFASGKTEKMIMQCLRDLGLPSGKVRHAVGAATR